MATEQWVTAEQVAQHLGIAKDTRLYRWREHKELPAHRVGRLWNFNLRVDDWVNAGGAYEDKMNDSTGHQK